MPASLLEAFAVPSLSGTESLHNPRYEMGSHQVQALVPLGAPLVGPASPPPVKSQTDIKSSHSSNSLDDETKCDLHLYHILACQTCRKRLKSLLVISEPAMPATPVNNQNNLNQLMEGLLGLNLNEKIQAAIQSNAKKTEAVTKSKSKFSQSIIFYILIGIFILYVLDLLFRRRWS